MADSPHTARDSESPTSLVRTVCECCEKPTQEPVYSEEGDAFCGACAVSLAGEAFNRLAELVAQKATMVPGNTGYPYNTTNEHARWALWGSWRAGGRTSEEARKALVRVIREEILT